MEINKETDQESLQKRYQEVISRTQYLLEEDQEWAERYRGYYEADMFKNISLCFNDNSPYADDKLELHCISISISGEDEIKLMSDKDF